jgi:hypothetical protein
MAHLYSILTEYAQKKQYPLIEVTKFLDFLGQYVKRYASKEAEGQSWTVGTRSKFWEELKQLIEEGTCILQRRGKLQYLYLPAYCAVLIEKMYHAAEDPPDKDRIPPFPAEAVLKISLPPESYLGINVSELAAYLENPPPSEALISMAFPEPLEPILLLGSMVLNMKLLEAAFIRVRHHLAKDLNLDFFQKRIGQHLHGREEYPRDMLNKLVQQTGEAVDSLMESDESSYLVWFALCTELKNDLGGKKLLTGDEGAVLQAAHIIEQFNLFYNGIAQKRRDKEEAFNSVFALLGKAPYLFKAAQIVKFEADDGEPLLANRYTNEELFDYLDELNTPKEDKLPRLIILNDAENTEQWYILKNKLPLLCVRYLVDAHAILKNAILDHWEDALLDYETEESMTDPNMFEFALWRYLHSLIPPLAAMLEYKQLSDLCKEMTDSWDGYTEFVKLMNKETGKLQPLSALLFLNQKHLLSTAKERLPFLYMFPFIGKIIRFFRRQKKKTADVRQASPSQSAPPKDGPLTIKAICGKLEAALVPEGYTSEWYLLRLYETWASPLNKNEKMNEINRLIRNRIRRNAPLYKLSQINDDFLNEIANGLIEDTPLLKQPDQESLKLYIKLYSLNLLRTMRRSGFKA